MGSSSQTDSLDARAGLSSGGGRGLLCDLTAISELTRVVDFSACPAFYSLLLWSGDFHAQPETGSQDFGHPGKSLDQGLHLAQVPGSPSSEGTCANACSLQSCRCRCQGGRTEALGAGTSPKSHWGGGDPRAQSGRWTANFSPMCPNL